MNTGTISRRRFATRCMAVWPLAGAVRVSAQSKPGKNTKRALRLVREFSGGAGLLAASPQGDKLCVEFVPGGPVFTVGVVEIGTWHVLWSDKFTAQFFLDASFFAGGQAIYVDTLGPDT